MKAAIHFRYAVLSFCPDLTSPQASSIPLAIAGVCSTRGADFWFTVTKQRPADDLQLGSDKIAIEILNDLPLLFDRQVTTAVSQVQPREFTSWLHDRFRNSLHVSDIQEVTKELSCHGPHELFNKVHEVIATLYFTHVLPSKKHDGAPRKKFKQPNYLELPNVGVRPIAKKASKEVGELVGSGV